MLYQSNKQRKITDENKAKSNTGERKNFIKK